MSQSMPVLNKTFKAAGDLSATQFHAVVMSAAYTVNLAGANARIVGIQQNAPNAAGLGTVVRLLGTSKMVVEGGSTSISAGDPLETDGSGHGIKCTTDKHHVFAIALEASSASGDIIEVLIVNFDAGL